jgi:cysteine-rich repeat protein
MFFFNRGEEMNKYFVVLIMVFTIFLFSCEPNIVDGQFSCDPNEINTCPEGFACLRKGTDENFYCFKSAGEICGNNVKDTNEQCDGMDFGGENPCASGYAICTTNCRVNCSVCGNGLLEQVVDATGNIVDGEECDDGSTISGDGCSPNCVMERLYCIPSDYDKYGSEICAAWCGDGIKNGSEICDGDDVTGSSCQNNGFYSGELSCDASCNGYDTSDCTEFCGDGIINGQEICDGIEHKYQNSCEVIGSKHCDAYCMFNYDTCVENSWEKIEFNYSLNAIWGTDENNIYVVGEDGVILNYDGISWTTMTSNATEDLKAIWGTDKNNIYVVGNNGVILYYNGVSWNPMNSNSTETLRGVWGADASNVYAVGYQSTILHYDGNSWNSMNSGTTESFHGVWGTDASNVYAVGNNGKIVHYDGISWTIDSTSTEALYGVWGSDASNIYVVGMQSTILHYDGISWNTIDSNTFQGLKGVWGDHYGNMYTAGVYELILHWNGNDLLTMKHNLENSTSTTYLSIWGDLNNIYFLKSNEIHKYKGTDFFEMNKNNYSYQSIYGVDRKNIYTCTHGRVHYFNGLKWVLIYDDNGDAEPIYSVWASSSNNVYIANDIGLMNYDGISWNTVDSTITDNIYKIWGSDASNIFGIKSGGSIVNYDGISWTTMNSGTTEHLESIWGFNKTNLFAVGYSGTILYYDGISWTTMDSGTTENLNSIWGTSLNNLFVAGENGTIIHYNGTTWSQMESGTNYNISSIMGVSPNNIFAVGQFGTIIHYDGNIWSNVSLDYLSLDFSSINLNSIWINSEGLFIAGDNIILFFDHNVIPTLEGGVCEEPVVLYCNVSERWGDNSYGKITLDGSGNPVFDTYPTWNSTDVTANSGPESFYRLDNPVTGKITVRITPHEGNVNLVVLNAFDVGCDPDAVLYISSNDGTQIEEITFDGTQGETYYIIVDSEVGETSPYSIEVDCMKK